MMSAAAAAEDASSTQRLMSSATASSDATTTNVHLKGIKYVIFPENKFLRVWDTLMILVIIFYTFYIPFHGGISGGYLIVTSRPFFCFVVSMNAIFFIDTFICFFRAYRDEKGLLVFSLRSIALNYIRSGWFFINLLASFPTTAIDYSNYKQADPSSGSTFFIFELFKLLRLLRINVKIKQTLRSEVVTKIYEHVNLAVTLMLKFLFLIIVVSHWFGCIWGYIAYYENGHTWENLDNTTNWISNWYNSMSDPPPGSLNPIGFNNFMGRYWLCLFWAIQTITSVGYGNIIPVTTLEFAVANVLMLCSGIFWAYVIGSLVDVVAVASKLQNEYVERMDKANRMVANFEHSKLPESITGSSVDTKPSKRVRRFLTNQRDHCTKNWLDEGSSLALSEEYPTLDILSPELRKVCALNLTHNFLETIPYLSSKYLSPSEQAEIALQCRTLEFAAGEHFSSHPEFGRGILIFRQGLGFTSRNLTRKCFTWTRGIRGHAIDVNEVLVEDEYYKEKQLIYHFVNYTKAIFLPREAIMKVLEKNQRAWKDCARWRYFGATLVLYSLKDAESLVEIV